MQRPKGNPISEKRANEMIDLYQSGKVPFRPGKEKGCINAVAFNKKALINFLNADDHTEVRLVMGAHPDGVPTIVLQTYSIESLSAKESAIIGMETNSFEDGLTCPPFEPEVCNPG